MSEEEGVVWIKTDMTPDQTGYVVTIEATDDVARILSPTEVMRYAAGIMAAVSRAEYDAAILRQMMVKLGLDKDTAVQIISDLRADRVPLDPSATAPMQFVPSVTKDLKPFLVVSCQDRPLGQWEISGAREHVLAVLEAVAVADLDSGYLQTLVGMVGIDRGRAMQIVEDVGNHRDASSTDNRKA